MQVSPPNRLVKLYRGRGGRPSLEGASLNCWPVWRVVILFLGGIGREASSSSIAICIFGSSRTLWVHALRAALVRRREKGISFVTYYKSTSSSRMNSNAERDIFVHISTPAGFNTNNLPTWHNSHVSTDTTGRQWGRGEGGDGPPDQLENRAVSHPLRILQIFRRSVGFLDLLCWGNQSAIVGSTVRRARTNLVHSN